MSDSRLFKATRRSIRAEVTLIAVIVISFSWSAYALYKLALGSSDSLFDFGLSQTKRIHQQQQAAQLSHSKPIDEAQVDLEARNLTEQLAIYKSQILKELLARQKQLLIDRATDRLPTAQVDIIDYTRSQPETTSTSGQQVNRIGTAPRAVNVEELKQWRGGFRMPATIDYLFDASKRPLRNQPQANSTHVDRIASSSNEHVQRSQNLSLVPLTDGQSLMQLRKFEPPDNQQSDAQTTRVKEKLKLWHNDDELNEPNGDEPRLHNDEAINGDISVTEGQSHSEATTTTISPPPTSFEQENAETTTVEPAPSVASDETTPSLMKEISEEEDSKKDENTHEQDQATQDQAAPFEENKVNSSNGNDDESNDDDGSMERVKNAVHTIDEEVERMTQPSLGMASQQDQSFDYKNTVHFDDSLPGSIQRELDIDIETKVPKSSEAGFDQHEQHRPTQRQSEANDDTDLQVADNRSKSPIGVAHAASPVRAVPRSSEKVRKLPEPKGSARANSKKNELPSRKDTKTGSTTAVIKQRQTGGAFRRERRSTEANLISKTLDSLEPSTHARRNRKSLRRQDLDDQDDSDGDNHSDSNEEDDQKDSRNTSDSHFSPEERLHSSYQTITSNDPTIQELLAHKRLLDELQQSQVPSPVAWLRPPENQLQPQQQALNSTTVEPSRQPNGLMVSEGKAGKTDHQPADTHYTVDHGLLLYPAEDEEHHHKSMSKKSKNSSNKKAKKKMTVAMKKGGHKKKKHKKEEKKYLKEKKFKGAKKGKKMSKGKGGKGGKKGKKYYKDKGFKKKGFKNIYVKNEFGQKKSYFDEFRDKDFKKKWKNFDDKYNYAQMKKWQAKDVKGAKKMKDQGEHYKKYDKGKWKKKYHKHQQSESAKKKKKQDEF